MSTTVTILLTVWVSLSLGFALGGHYQLGRVRDYMSRLADEADFALRFVEMDERIWTRVNTVEQVSIGVLANFQGILLQPTDPVAEARSDFDWFTSVWSSGQSN